jgi:DNA-binding transcriptional MocR family regulator
MLSAFIQKRTRPRLETSVCVIGAVLGHKASQNLMEFKWDSNAPFPGYATLAQRMGISVKMARRHAQTLEGKKYLRREMRRGRTNRFDLSPLFEGLLTVAQAEKENAIARRRASKGQDEMIEWANHMMDAFRNMSKKDRKALVDWEAANLDGKNGATSDWPGWEHLIGKKPEA